MLSAVLNNHSINYVEFSSFSRSDGCRNATDQKADQLNGMEEPFLTDSKKTDFRFGCSFRKQACSLRR